MLGSQSAPSIAPSLEETVYLVLDDSMNLGCRYRQTDKGRFDFNSVVEAMLSGDYKKPMCVVALNPAAGWCGDVSRDIAREVLTRAVAEGGELPAATAEFINSQLGARATVTGIV
jgi:hypothetical protein